MQAGQREASRRPTTASSSSGSDVINRASYTRSILRYAGPSGKGYAFQSMHAMLQASPTLHAQVGLTNGATPRRSLAAYGSCRSMFFAVRDHSQLYF